VVRIEERPLTPPQARVLRFIQDSTAKRGFPPTVREIARDMGYRSTNAVADVLVALERKGKLKTSTQKARGISVPRSCPHCGGQL
jgi:repressor LexA